MNARARFYGFAKAGLNKRANACYGSDGSVDLYASAQAPYVSLSMRNPLYLLIGNYRTMFGNVLQKRWGLWDSGKVSLSTADPLECWLIMSPPVGILAGEMCESTGRVRDELGR
jgi:hypothetical protein